MRGRHRRRSRTVSLITTAATGTAVAGTIVSALPASASTGVPEAPSAPVSASATLAPVRAVADTVRASQPRTYTVQSGDTLSKIAGSQCGNPADWSGIWMANKGKVPDYNLIYPGQQLILSCKTAIVPVETVVTSVVTPRHVTTVPASSPGYHQVTVSGGTLSFAGLENLWVSAGGPAWAESSAAAVAECESGGRSSAYNPSGATGLWQILGAVVGGNLYDPYVNALNAVSKFKASGDTWAQWVCQP